MTSVNPSIHMHDDDKPSRRTLPVESGILTFLEWPHEQGKSPLHFAHANGFNAMTYRRLLNPLSGRFRIRAWDARGHGETLLPADPASHSNWHVFRDDMILMLERFADVAGSPVLLAGHSMGATVSLMVAAERPDLVRGLCLVDPVLIPRHIGRLMRFIRRFGLKAPLIAIADAAERRRAVFPDRATMFNSYRGRGAFRTWPDDVLRDYIEGGTIDLPDGQVALTCSPGWEAANFRAQGHDVWEAIEALARPLTLIYSGPTSSTCRAPGPQLLAECDPGATILRIGQASHFLPMEYPEAVRRELLALDARITG
ncbi:MAG: alpha/beta hydrolase [Parvibaculum sp.]